MGHWNDEEVDERHAAGCGQVTTWQITERASTERIQNIELDIELTTHIERVRHSLYSLI